MGKENRRVTIKDLASVCGVSTATISRVLNHIKGGYSAETEAMVLETAEKMGYVFNPMARSLVTRKTGLIAVLVPDIHYHFFQDFLAGLEEHLDQYGYRLLLCDTQGSQQKEQQYIQSLSNGLVDGIVVSTLNGREKNKMLLEMQERRFPVLGLERYGEEMCRICSLGIDNVLAGQMAVDYLYERGHRRIAFIRGAREAKNAELRYQGYLRGLEKFGIPMDEQLVVFGDYSFEGGIRAARELLERDNFTALIAANDLMTVGACKTLIRTKYKIPRKISVLGLDRTILTDTYEPTIAAVDFCARKLGEKAGEYLMAMVGGEDLRGLSYILKPELYEGKSVRAVSAEEI